MLRWFVVGRRDLTPVGDLIDLVLGQVARSDVAPIVSLRQSWDVVAGEWSGKCRPTGLTAGVLTVEVDNGMVASMLRFAGPPIVAAAREHLGAEPKVERLNVRIARTKG